MKTNGNEPINALIPNTSISECFSGLTKREHMAIEFTKAFIISPERKTYKHCVSYGLEMADELINQLNKTEK